MSSSQSNEGEIRKNIIEADLVDCMVALPSQLFYNTMIPACLWFIARDKINHKFRDRRGEILFIDARKLGAMMDRRHRELTSEGIKKISDTYHAWRGEPIDGQKVEYKDVAGFCNAIKIEEIRKQNYILTPGRYISAEIIDDDKSSEDRIRALISKLDEQLNESSKLDKAIQDNWKRLKI
jgi:type I restriction enzyme M protein